MENQTYQTYAPQNLVIDSNLTPGTEEYRTAYQKAYRKKNSDRLKSYDKIRFEGRRKRAHQVGRYSITPEEYEIKLIEQDYRCAICKTHQSELKTSLCVDHNHKTGENRGLLCDLCNRGIGMLQDNPEILDVAAAYIRRYTTQKEDVFKITSTRSASTSA